MTPCVLWEGARNSTGYGVKRYRGKLWLAHRVAYTEQVGEIPQGLELDHLCRTRACVNVEHLDPVTHWENINRSPHKQKPREFCERGHSKAEHGFRTPGKSGVQCRACANERQRRYVARKLNREGGTRCT